MLSQGTIEKLGGGTILRQYPSYFEALIAIFPEKSWEITDLPFVPRNYYDKIEKSKRKNGNGT